VLGSFLNQLDAHFTQSDARPELVGWQRIAVEFCYFGIRQARACLFAGLFFAAVFAVPRGGLLGIPRYDVLLILALGIQAWMLYAKLETWDEFKAILLFHLMGFALEAFKVSANVRSWTYPDFAYSKVMDVPLFAGFMYAAVGSYIIQVWRALDMRVVHHPPYWMTGIVAVALYVNFFTHRYMGDYRWYLGAIALGLYARCWVEFRPLDRKRRMPLIIGLILVGFFIWLAENAGTFFGLWKYPNQIGAWTSVHLGKWSSWTALTLLTFTIVVNLKHVKERIHLAP
jgi:uncharacterized membrane protein YoaT (DUF817 family)